MLPDIKCHKCLNFKSIFIFWTLTPSIMCSIIHTNYKLSENLSHLFFQDSLPNSLFDTLPPIGIIPGGSGNGFAKSLSYFSQEDFSPLQSCYNVIEGQPKAMDLTKLTTDKGQEFYSFLSISYGFTSDCDIESESLRFLVSKQRFTYYK